MEVVRRDKTFQDDAGRKALLKVFDLLGHAHPLVPEYRDNIINAFIFLEGRYPSLWSARGFQTFPGLCKTRAPVFRKDPRVAFGQFMHASGRESPHF